MWSSSLLTFLRQSEWLTCSEKRFFQQYLMRTLGLSQQWEQVLQHPGDSAGQGDDTMFKCCPSPTSLCGCMAGYCNVWQTRHASHVLLVVSKMFKMKRYFIKKDHISGIEERSCSYASSVYCDKKKKWEVPSDPASRKQFMMFCRRICFCHR